MVHVQLILTKNYGGHGLLFQNRMKEIFGDNVDYTYHNLNTDTVREKYKAKFVCTNCDAFYYRIRVPYKYLNILCNLCMSKMKIIKLAIPVLPSVAKSHNKEFISLIKELRNNDET